MVTMMMKVKLCSSMMLMLSNEDEYVCLNSMDQKKVENRFDIAMVCNLYVFEDEF